MYSYLLPFQGGMALRAYYLKQKYKFSYAAYSSFLSGYYIINFLVASMIGATVAILFNLNFPVILWFIFGGVFLACISIIFIYLFIKINQNITSNNRFFNFLVNAYKSFIFYKENPKLTLKVALIQALFTIAMAVRLYLSFSILNIETNLSMVLFVQSIVTFSRVISITPGNIGIKEGLIGVSSSLLGISAEEALLGAILDRMVSILLIFLLGIIYSRFLLKKLNT